MSTDALTLACVASSIQTMAPSFTETVLVRHGKLIGRGGAATVGTSITAA